MSTTVFWRPGAVKPGSSIDRASESEGNVIPSGPVSLRYDIQSQRELLPIFKYKRNILFCIEKFGVVIVHAQTGAGKTTPTLEIPQYLYEAGWAEGGSVIGCTQPRRVATTSIAQRVASEQGSTLGDEVGYTIRFEDVSDKMRTRIHYMTDGILFREAQLDPLLSRYSVIMIDEAHERSVYTDLLLGILKKIRRKRPSLRLIISSATIDATYFLQYFNNEFDTSGHQATIVTLEGRSHPVELAYLEQPIADYVKASAEVAWRINNQNGRDEGDILIFLTGREEIERCLEELSNLVTTHQRGTLTLNILPLHSGLTPDEQMKIFEPSERGSRKVIVATNIAEASITIDGIKFVIDCGFVKCRLFKPSTGLASLVTIPASLASVTQRAGRAGRTSPGICYRLYPEHVLRSLPRSTSPEITRSDLAVPILQLKYLGIDDLMKFDWVTSPPAENVLRAVENLVALGMISEDGRLTAVGEKVAECPLDVNIAQMLFISKEFKCGEEILTIAAMVCVQDVFIIQEGATGALGELERRKFVAAEGDHLTLLNVYNAFTKYGMSANWCRSHFLNFRALSRAVSIRSQLKKYMHRFKLPLDSCEGDAKRLRHCLVCGYWKNAAQWMADGTYRSVRGNIVLHVNPRSVMFTRKPQSGWVVFHEMEESKMAMMHILTEIEPEWLLEYGHKYLDKN